MTPLPPEQFLYEIWPRDLLTHETLELRAKKRSDDSIRREFFTSVEEFLKGAQQFGDGWDIYFGVSTRFQSGGKKRDCYRVKCVWIDLDKKEVNNFDPVPPDIIVKSGGGSHVYWLLKQPVLVRTGRWVEIEAINRSLSKRFGGDIGAIDISRILRVPGFFNYKYDPPQEVQAFECTNSKIL